MGNNLSSFQRDFGLIIVGAVVFTASFLWKDLLSDIEELYFPKNQGILGRIIFTILVTVVLLLIAVHIRSVFGLSVLGESPIEFDDSPIDDNNLHINNNIE